ncbi:MAG: ABC-F family ATP-binding cassette domain-containing protein, partial [Proteobacteria bacterium]|nr:ABC-F family ATP-binding cassette domain-containing protein [Pseudomonadota bacterium]
MHVTFGGTPLLTAAELMVHPGDRLGLVGRNGSGKSTLLKIAGGLIEPDEGERIVQRGATMRYLAQEPRFETFATTLDAATEGLHPGDDPHRARHLLERLGLTGAENPATLSGGELRRCALAQALAPEPDILLLDEPTNHLDLPAIEWLESELAGTRAALIVISHDRRFLSTLTRATLWLDRGQVRRHEQGFAAFETWRDRILEEEEMGRHKLDRKIVAEEHWVRYGVSARRKRNQKRLRDLSSMRQTRREQRGPAGNVAMSQHTADPSGKMVAETKAITKSFDSRPIVADLSLQVQRGDRLAIIGPNGAGKTTLLNLLTGALKPDSGTVKLGANIKLVSLDQRRDALRPSVTLRDALTGGGSDVVETGAGSKHVIGYMKDFLFTPEQAGTPVGVLSGGERGRLMLAIGLAKPSNVLVLDEPTNDLDLETLDLLQELLADYSGTVLLVSHDRDFIDRVATSVLAFEESGIWIEYSGGYSDMIAQRGYGVSPLTRGQDSGPRRNKRNRAENPSSAPTQKRLGFKEQHALKVLPERIAMLEQELKTLDQLLSDSGLYTRNPETFNAAVARREAAQQALDAAEQEWLALEILR